ncbi:MAG: magnesium transporter [Solirubrobacterales bacterium]|nr:magnesium transporter [Solirubrobacterales bacterium]
MAATGDFPLVTAAAGETVAAVLERLAGAPGEDVVVVDRGRVVGLANRSELRVADRRAPVEEVMEPRLTDVLEARLAAEEPVARRLVHRLPWLLIGLAGAMASAILMGAFDARLEANVVIAFFVPAIVYMADAVGTQTEAVLIRALAAGVRTRAIVTRELLSGLIMGLAVGVAFFVFAAVGWGDARVAIAVALALVASCSVATAVAMILPTIFQRLGRDPAFGSGPLATVVQDLLSIAVYFAIVSVVVF